MQTNSVFGKKIIDNWYLNKEITFLNHGSFGATPKQVLNSLFKWNELLETQPLEFFLDKYYDLIRLTASNLASFLKAESENIVFVENATTGVNSVLFSLLPEFKPDDEILFTNHVYPAVRNTIHYINKITETKANELTIPLPVKNKKEIIDAISNAINERTKILVLDYISSPTGIIFPVKEICRICKERGILTLIDAAHAPGMVNFSIDEIRPDWFTGNCHKWLFAPKGCAFLWTKKDLQYITHPLAISLNYEQGYTKEFDWTGTKNPSSYLALDEALNFVNSYGLENIMDYNNELAIEARELISKEINAEVIVPESMIGSLFAIPLPIESYEPQKETVELRNLMLKEYKIEVPFTSIGSQIFVRPSAQIYNEIEDYYKLADALKKIIK